MTLTEHVDHSQGRNTINILWEKVYVLMERSVTTD